MACEVKTTLIRKVVRALHVYPREEFVFLLSIVARFRQFPLAQHLS